ncbi:hypothetical protein TNCV_4845181 [Trichonephila clavipes]|uniref:Uncharacterized protein n=1 Tax=Trichonephila clavipes TaxID=2585209 RepID=A0A8X6WLX5_TRICX|nr:hypothetical protein TNCV_4845181 [Trichonephila clavipes]
MDKPISKQKIAQLNSLWIRSLLPNQKSTRPTSTTNKQSTVPPAHHWCSACQASTEHILDYLQLSKQDLYEDPLMVLDVLRVNDIMDLV